MGCFSSGIFCWFMFQLDSVQGRLPSLLAAKAATSGVMTGMAEPMIPVTMSRPLLTTQMLPEPSTATPIVVESVESQKAVPSGERGRQRQPGTG